VSRETEPFCAERFEYGLPYTSDPNRVRKGMLTDWAAERMVLEQPTKERAATGQRHEPANSLREWSDSSGFDQVGARHNQF